MKKYILTDEVKRPMGIFAYRIQALKDFGDVKAGDYGGYVSTEANLNQEGDCWIYNDAMSLENGRVEQNAKLYNNAKIHGNAAIGGNAKMYDNTAAFDSAIIFDEAKLYGNSNAYGRCEIFSNAEMADMSKASQNAWVGKDVILKGEANVTEKTTKTPIVISGLYYNVTVMDNHLSVDCMTRTRGEWMEISNRELLLFDGKPAVRFFNEYRDMLNMVAMLHQSNPSNL